MHIENNDILICLSTLLVQYSGEFPPQNQKGRIGKENLTHLKPSVLCDAMNHAAIYWSSFLHHRNFFRDLWVCTLAPYIRIPYYKHTLLWFLTCILLYFDLQHCRRLTCRLLMVIVRNVDTYAITIVTRRRPATQNASLTFSSELAAAETTTCRRSGVVSICHYSLSVFHQHSQ